MTSPLDRTPTWDEVIFGEDVASVTEMYLDPDSPGFYDLHFYF